MRALEPPSYKPARIRLALAGELDHAVHFPIPWSYAADVAAITVAALDRGVAGGEVLAFPPADVCSTAEFLNRACELAGSDRRIRDSPRPSSTPTPLWRTRSARASSRWPRRFPEPYFRDPLTRSPVEHVSAAPGRGAAPHPHLAGGRAPVIDHAEILWAERGIRRVVVR